MNIFDLLQQLAQGQGQGQPQGQPQGQAQPQPLPTAGSPEAAAAMAPPPGINQTAITGGPTAGMMPAAPLASTAPEDPMTAIPGEMLKMVRESQKRSAWAESLLRGWLEDSTKPYQDPNAPKGTAGRAVYNILTGFFGGIPGMKRRMLDEQQARQWQQTRIQEAQQYVQNAHAQQSNLGQMMSALAMQARIAAMERRNDIIEKHNDVVDPARVTHMGAQSTRDLASASAQQFGVTNPKVGGGMLDMAQTQATGAPVWTVAPPLSRQPVGPQMMAASVDKVMREAVARDPSIPYNPQNPPKSLLDLPNPALRQQAILDYNRNFHYELPDIAQQRALNNARMSMVITDMKTGRVNLPQIVEQAAMNPEIIAEPAFQSALKDMKVAGQFSLAWNNLTGLPMPRKVNQTAIPEGVAGLSLYHIRHIEDLMKDPRLASKIGPITGRLENLGMRIGTDILGGDPELVAKAQDLRTSLQYVFMREGKAVLSGRPAERLMEELKDVSARGQMDPALLSAALGAAKQASQAVISEATDYRFGTGAHNTNRIPTYGPGSSAPLPPTGASPMQPGRSNFGAANRPGGLGANRTRKTFYDRTGKPTDFELVGGQWQPVTK